MEEEDEQEDQDQEEGEVERQPTSPSDLGGVPWKEAVELHAQLRADFSEGEEGDAVSRDGQIDEEDDEDEEEEDEDDEQSSEGRFSFCDYMNMATCCLFPLMYVNICPF